MNGIRTSLLCPLMAIGAIASADTYVVTNNSGNLLSGSLRSAVVQANGHPGADRIEFNLPSNSTFNIELSGIISITDPVTIDGSTQPGFVDTPIIRITSPPPPGANQPTPAAILLGGGSDGSIISDLSFVAPQINNFLQSADFLMGVGSSFNLIYNCRFGIDSVPIYKPNTAALVGSSLYNTITHCMIGNCHNGIAVGVSDGTWIFDNAIGTDFTETSDFGCGFGVIVIGSNDVVIGAIGNEPGNIIANSSDTAILSHFLPVVDIYSNVSVRKNKIYNTGDIPFKIGNNSIAHLPNDSNDSDFLNQLGPQNHAVISYVGRAEGQYVILGELRSTPNTPLIIDFYANDVQTSLLYGEAQHYLGSANISTDSNGKALFSETFPDTLLPSEGAWVSSLTSRAIGGATSQFSLAKQAVDFTFFSESDPDTDSAWIPSGLDSGPENLSDPASPDDVDIDTIPGARRVIVRPSVGRYRIAGWRNPGLFTIPGNANLSLYIGKFYIYTNVPDSAPLNTVPNFRIRLGMEDSQLATAMFQYSATGEGGVPGEPFYDTVNNPARELRAGAALRPSSNPAKPSLYRVQLFPIPVPSAFNARIGASFESFAVSNVADGTLAMTELTVAHYPFVNVHNDFEPIFTYSKDLDYETTYEPNSANAQFIAGKFNAEADFQPGRRQAIDLESEVGPAQLAEVYETVNTGTILDTLQTPANKFGIGIINIASNNPVTSPRIEPGKTYMAQFAVSSDVPTSSMNPLDVTQGGLLFEMQTGMGAVIYRNELAGPVNVAALTTTGGQILAEALPGLGCVNPFTLPIAPAGEVGGRYQVYMPSPLSPDIRADNGGNLGAFAAEPGYGENVDSARDIHLGVIGIESPDTLKISPTVTVPFARPNRAKVRLLGATLYELPELDDGGYTY